MKHLILALALAGCTTEFSPEDLDGADVNLPDETPDEPMTDTEEDAASDGEGPDEGDAPCTVFYLDADGDGYGGQTEECLDTWETGYSTNSDDCCDSIANVKPTQTIYFTSPYYCPGESWDYNCDGEITFQHGSPADDSRINCASSTPPSCEGRGWADAAPSCGDVAEHGRCIHLVITGVCAWEADWEGVVACR